MFDCKRKIMTYPFTGLDYEQIKEVGGRVRIICDENNFEVKYIIPSYDEGFGSKRDIDVIIEDDSVKYTLCYFSFLNSMCRYNCDLPIFKAIDRKMISYNTYIDTILISINEIVSDSKCNDNVPDFNELLYRFGKQYSPNDLNRLYDNESGYKYLNGLFKFLVHDDFFGHVSNYKNNGIYIDKICDDSVLEIVNRIVDNMDVVDVFSMHKRNISGPMMTKKISRTQVI